MQLIVTANTYPCPHPPLLCMHDDSKLSFLTHPIFSSLSKTNRDTSRDRSETPMVPTSPTRSSTTPVSGFARPRRPWSSVSSKLARISAMSTFCKYFFLALSFSLYPSKNLFSSFLQLRRKSEQAVSHYLPPFSIACCVK